MDESEYKKMRNKIKNNINNLLDFYMDQFSNEFEEGIMRIAIGGILGDISEENDAWFSARNYHREGEECE